MWHALWGDRPVEDCADRPRHQRRAPPELGGPRWTASPTATSARLARPRADAPMWGERRRDLRRRLWRPPATSSARRSWTTCGSAARPTACSGRVREYAEAAARAFDTQGADPRLRAAHRHVQALDLLIRDAERAVALSDGRRRVQSPRRQGAPARRRRQRPRAGRCSPAAGLDPGSASASSSCTTTTSRSPPASCAWGCDCVDERRPRAAHHWRASARDG
jgi:hypothetical protein